MKEFKGSVAVVTGAGSGIGAAMARALAKAGMKVAVADIEAEAADETANAICANGGQAVAYRVDITQPTSVAELKDQVRAAFGTCHLVCANAGVCLFGRLEQRSLKDWEWVFSVNVMGTVHTVQAFLPMLKEHPGNAHIVITASMSGLLAGAPGKGVYNASKHAVMAYGETLREEMSDEGVGVSLLMPGGVKSRIVQSGRNRPREFGESTPVTEADIQLVIRGTGDTEAAEPDYAVRNLLRGIEQNQPWIFTHESKQWPRIEQRFAAILRACDLAKE